MFLAAKQDRYSPHKAVLLANGRGITHRPRVKHVEQICSIPLTRLYCRPTVRLLDSGISVHRASGCSRYPSYRPAHLAQQMSQPPGSSHPHTLRLYIYIYTKYLLFRECVEYSYKKQASPVTMLFLLKLHFLEEPGPLPRSEPFFCTQRKHRVNLGVWL